MTFFGKPVLPKEHGVWVLLLAPLFAGSFAPSPADGLKPVAAALLAATAVFGMMMFEPLKLIMRPSSAGSKARGITWLCVYMLAAAITFALLQWLHYRPGLFAFAAAGLPLGGLKMWAGASRIQRETWVEVLGVLGLSLTAPAALYVQTGELSPAAGAVYILCALWFVDRVMTARRTLEEIRTGRSFGAAQDKIQWYKKELYIHSICLGLAAVFVIASSGVTPWTAFPPFLLATVKFRFDLKNIAPLPGPMQVGYGEMRLSSLFAALLAMAFHFSS